MIKALLLYILLLLALIYLCIALYLYARQRHILYLPVKRILSPLHHHLQGFETVTLLTSDHLKLTAWYKKAQHPDAPTILYLHGNAGNIADRSQKFAALTAQGMGLLALSYRGYGTSEGSPTEQGLYIDARTALSYLRQEQQIPLSHLILYGESLGSGVATYLALHHSFKAMILEAPFTSITNIAQNRYPFLPIALLLKDTFPSITRIAHIHTPLLIIHGALDTTTPIRHGQTLYQHANHPKQLIIHPTTNHADFNPNTIAAQVEEFIEELENKKN